MAPYSMDIRTRVLRDSDAGMASTQVGCLAARFELLLRVLPDGLVEAVPHRTGAGVVVHH